MFHLAVRAHSFNRHRQQSRGADAGMQLAVVIALQTTQLDVADEHPQNDGKCDAVPMNASQSLLADHRRCLLHPTRPHSPATRQYSRAPVDGNQAKRNNSID
jgi:hypothetical protein